MPEHFAVTFPSVTIATRSARFTMLFCTNLRARVRCYAIPTTTIILLSAPVCHKTFHFIFSRDMRNTHAICMRWMRCLVYVWHSRGWSVLNLRTQDNKQRRRCGSGASARCDCTRAQPTHQQHQPTNQSNHAWHHSMLFARSGKHANTYIFRARLPHSSRAARSCSWILIARAALCTKLR